MARRSARGIGHVVSQLVSIQILRGLAALAVAYGHAGHDASLLAARQSGPFHVPFAALSGAGVDLFFAISGFVMVLSSQRLFAQPGASRQFMVRRLARIVPIYWLATGLFVLIMAFAPASLNSGAATVADVIRSLLFIPYQRAGSALIQPVYGLGWTLNYEMFFYCLFAVAVMLPMRFAVAGLIALLILLAVGGAIVAPEAAALKFWTAPIILEFAFGMAIAALYLSRWRPGRGVGLALLGFGLALFVWLNASGDMPDIWARVGRIGIPMALVLAGSVLACPGSSPLLQPLAGLGDASYALYLFHPMAVRALSVAWGRAGLPAGWMFVVVALVASIALAVALYRYFERPLTRALQARTG